MGFSVLFFYICLCAFVVGVGGLCLYNLFDVYSECSTLYIFEIFTIIVSLLYLFLGIIIGNVAESGTTNYNALLSSCLIFLFSIYLCWYSVVSHPNIECNPNANKNTGDYVSYYF